jgi:geranylgeranyl diphosphate synthase type II
MDVDAYLAEQAARVDRFLDARVPGEGERPGRLHAAMRHLLFPGGKRFRPALAFAAARAVGGDPAAALPVAAAVELVHTYSLVHDDLPCMDDDALRRGRPTVHVAFDEATAVLAGDALLAEAFRVLLEAEGLAAEVRVGAARDLAEAAGSRALVGGQAEDLAAGARPGSAGDGPDAEAVAWIHERKTAALMRAAVVAGARVAGAGPATLERLGRFARDAGVAFQIADDLLDAAGGEAPEPCSLVTVLGRDAAAERAEALLESALAQLDGLGEPAEPLRELARFAVRRRT